MSEDFIPLHMSTPVYNEWIQDNKQKQERYFVNPEPSTSSGGSRQLLINSRNSYGSTPVYNRLKQYKRKRYFEKQEPSDSASWRGGYNQLRNKKGRYRGNSNKNNYNRGRVNIDDYILPSMLEDPWAELRKKIQLRATSTVTSGDLERLAKEAHQKDKPPNATSAQVKFNAQDKIRAGHY